MKLMSNLSSKTCQAISVSAAVYAACALSAPTIYASDHGHGAPPAAHAAEKHGGGHDEEVIIPIAKKPDAHAEAKPEHGETKDEKKEEKHADAHHDEAKKDEHASSAHGEAAETKGFFARIFGKYADAFQSVQDKVDSLRRAEEENRRLRLENANLRVTIEQLKFAKAEKAGQEQAKTVGKELRKETGTEGGRTLASIQYQIPENLLPDQLQALGVSYFKAKDDERAARIFTFLTQLDDDLSFRTPSNFLMLGVSWYRLENYRQADSAFDRVLREKPTEANRKAQTQARIWRGLVADRQGDAKGAQKWLLETMENQPQAKEARWINPQGEFEEGGARAPAAAHSHH